MLPMLIERLSAEELEMMDVYRKYNAWSYESYIIITIMLL